MNILVINGGSSTFKYAIYKVQADKNFKADLVWSSIQEFSPGTTDYELDVEKALSSITQDIQIVGHRVVHGGKLLRQPTHLTSEIIDQIDQLSRLAPLHNPINVLGIRIAKKIFPTADHIAVFDTAFFASIPAVACTYPIPYEFIDEGVQRYGFHGTSHHYCAQTAQLELGKCPEKMVTCHLGNGASCAAILNGQAIDTTMGFTPMEGLMMGTRSGSIDPGIILYLLREKKMTVEQVDRCLNKESGLLGIAKTSDMRLILSKKKEGDVQAKLAFDMYCYHIKMAVGALAASLGGLDVICFTGGIGENSQKVRDEILKGLRYMEPFTCLVIPAREDWFIAKQCYQKAISTK